MENKKSIWTKNFIMVCMMMLFSSMAAFMTFPLITKYALTIKDDISLASTISGLMSLSGLIVSPFAGLITDSFNQKKIIQYSSIFYIIILLAHIFATNIPLLIIVRLLVGFSFAVTSVTNLVFATNFIPREKVAEGLGFTALANIAAQAIAPGLGLQLVELSGYPLVFIASAFCVFCALVFVTLLPYEGNEIIHEKRRVRISDVIAFEYSDYLLMAAIFCIGTAWDTTFLAVIGDERGIANIGLFFAIYSIAMAFLRPLTGSLHDRKGIYYILIPAIITGTLGLILIGVGKTLMIMLAASVFKALGQGTGTAALQADVIKKMDPSRSGVATSTVLIGMHIGNAFGPMLGGQLVSAMGYQNMFVYFAVVSAILCFILLAYRYLIDKKKAGQN